MASFQLWDQRADHQGNKQDLIKRSWFAWLRKGATEAKPAPIAAAAGVAASCSRWRARRRRRRVARAGVDLVEVAHARIFSVTP